MTQTGDDALELLKLVSGTQKPVRFNMRREGRRETIESMGIKVEEVFGVKVREIPRNGGGKGVAKKRHLHLVKSDAQQQMRAKFSAKIKKRPLKSTKMIILHRIILPVNRYLLILISSLKNILDHSVHYQAQQSRCVRTIQ